MTKTVADRFLDRPAALFPSAARRGANKITEVFSLSVREEGADMIVGVSIELSVGLLCIVLGIVLWKKQKVSLVHEYHWKNVKKEDIPAYTRLLGTGLIVIGAGICVTGLLNLFESACWWIPMLAGFAAGLLVMNRAQKRYNGSWFS